ncbi:MAG: M20/M25/M40 family metallo-hydrolase [Phycisphaeraceae bacterium]|nr:M20/M25/M40 family metallo-hydrolase [Phycisphaeraceae bacterium]
MTLPALEWATANEQAGIDRLLDWLRIPSISTDPAYAADCRRAALWAAEHLRASGLAVEIHETGTPDKPGHPIVLATSPGEQDYRGPHVLFYGHYDVQPADPLDLWESPPFEPVVLPASGKHPARIVARGAVDDKGQVMMFLEALRAWKETTGKVAGGARFTVMLEGEEESGSVNLERYLRERASRLETCDVCLISDTGMLGRGKPAITYGVRGLAYTEVTLIGPNQDLHSGLWGGRVANPNTELCRILAGLWDADRRVTIPGFYDDVRDLAPSERDEWKRLGIDPAASLADIGLPPEADVGEKGFTSIEREWARPTAEINGLCGGYTGAGAKTVIPGRASAKVSFRLVADQHPEKIRDAFFAWLAARTPAGFRWELKDWGTGWPATVATSSPTLAAARRAIGLATGLNPALIKSGGSIPVAGLLKSHLGIETIFMGFGLEDDRVHSPNEKFEIDCYRMGLRSHIAFIHELRAMTNA